MYDRERLARLILDIGRYREDIDRLSLHSLEDLQDRRNFYALSMVLFSLLSALIGLGEEAVVGGNLGVASTYRQIFSLLEAHGWIDSPLFAQMSSLVSYRNRLAHEYGEITAEDLLQILARMEAVDIFVARVQEMVRSS